MADDEGGDISKSMKRRVTILCMDLANEGTARCVLLAKALERKYDVEILGTLWDREGRGVEPPWIHFHDVGVPIRSVIGKPWPGFVLTALRLLKRINGDIIIACKPRPASFGIALIKRLISGVPVVLDVDDDEIAITQATYRRGRWLNIGHPNQLRMTRYLRRYRHRADAAICVSDRFCREYDGVIAPHGRDPAEYDPIKYDGTKIRHAHGILDADHIVGFIGTPRRMKGIHVLIDALIKLDRPNVKLMIVGADPNASYTRPIEEQGGNRVIMIPPVPMKQVPGYIAASDLIVLPQTNGPLTSGQMPAKLTEAMAMAKPIVASAISDIPRYLDGCGILVPPEDPDELARQIGWVVDNPEEAKGLGRRARERFLKDMTTDYLFSVLDNCIESVFEKKGHR